MCKGGIDGRSSVSRHYGKAVGRSRYALSSPKGSAPRTLQLTDGADSCSLQTSGGWLWLRSSDCSYHGRRGTDLQNHSHQLRK